MEPVFTAHPTEAVRRALLEKEQLMVASLINGLDGTRTPGEQATDTARFRMALTSAWQTSDSSPVRPGVEDEREHVGFYLIEVLYRVIPVLYETLENAITEVYREEVLARLRAMEAQLDARDGGGPAARPRGDDPGRGEG